MLEQGISRGAENTSNSCFLKKSSLVKSKGLKQRAKALSDVKNTIHSHSSNFVVEKNKKDGKNKNSGKITLEKSVKTEELSKNSTASIDEKTKSSTDVSEPEFECNNHFLCEKVNNFYHAEFLDEYKLTKRELEYFGSRKKFFSVNPIPFKLNVLSPVEDVELRLTGIPVVFDEDIIEDVTVEVPEPPHY